MGWFEGKTNIAGRVAKLVFHFSSPWTYVCGRINTITTGKAPGEEVCGRRVAGTHTARAYAYSFIDETHPV